MSRDPPYGPRWHQRLSVRLALSMGAVTVALSWLSGLAHDWVHGWFDEVSIVNTRSYARDLLTGAHRAGPARYEPTPEGVARMAQVEGEDGLGFLWLDGEGLIVCTSPGLPWAKGTRFPARLERPEALSVPGRDPVRAYAFPIELAGELAGTFVSVLWDGALHAKGHGLDVAELAAGCDCPFYLGDHVDLATYEQLARRDVLEDRLATAVAVTVTVLAALLMAFATSHWVTRRLRRLARTASVPVAAGAALPGPFDAAGHDEIAALAGTLNAMRARVQQLVKDLASQDAQRREWIAQVSHDLRTPLTALLACLERAAGLASASGPGAGVKLADALAVAQLDARRVAVLAEDLLEIGRLDAGAELHLEPVPPGELARSAVRELMPSAEQRGLAFSAEVAHGLPVLCADGPRLLRALENLLQNAISHARRAVRLQVSAEAQRVVFAVLDDGPGFADGPAPPADRQGPGLGLVVTRRIVAAHRGTLEMANRPEGGALVRMWLPLDGAT